MGVGVGLLLVGIALSLPAGATAATTDFAYGAGVSDAGTPFAFSARSAANGSNPAGRAILGGIFGNSDGPVTCLRVQGHVAAVGFRVERSSVPSQVGRSYVSYLQDNGAFANAEPVDKVGTQSATGTPTSCPAADASRATSGLYGEAVVKDDSALPPPPGTPTWSLDDGQVESGSATSFRLAAMRTPDGGAIGYGELTGSGADQPLYGKVVCLDVDGHNARIGMEVDYGRSRSGEVAAEIFTVDGSDSFGISRFEDARNSGVADCRPPDPYAYTLTSGAVTNRSGDPLPAPPVRCGQTVRRNTTLAGDLHCAGDALTIGAPGITVDLGGHSVFGDAISIHNPGYDDVTVKDGTVVVDTSGLRLEGANGNVLQNLDLLGLQRGIELVGSDHNWIVGNRLLSVWMNVANGSDGNVIRGNTFLGYESSLEIRGSSHNLVSRNVVNDYWETAINLRLADHTVVSENEISAESGLGIYLGASDDNKISDNDIAGRPVGSQPIDVDGLTLVDSNRNLVARNSIQDTTTAIKVLSGWANVLEGNQSLLGVADGFLIEGAAVGSRLQGNWAHGFGGDGFDLRAPSTSIGTSTASGNKELGIRAVKGVTDLGGNRAFQNRNAFQCLNVVCAG